VISVVIVRMVYLQTLLIKLLPSISNVIIAYVGALSVNVMLGDIFTFKMLLIGIFFFHVYFCELMFGRCIGMMVCNTRYEQIRTPLQEFVYISLYTLSFSTLLFSMWFPLDVFMINILVLQLPFILFTKNTLHGFLSGNIKTAR
jgi:Zn-dependent protease with chaperone function